MKQHKFSSFLAIGGVASAALMQADLINYDLIVPELMVGVGALGIAKLVYERNYKSTAVKPKLLKGAFVALGGIAATVAYQHYHLPLQGVGQLALGVVAGYGLVATGKALFARKKAPSPTNESNFVQVTPKEKIQSVISKMREQAIEPTLEFKPLDLTRR
ncbi:TPA: hypothetical protein QDB51_003439 [Burkholderia vietnamiensis]|nr:hypothetical protein [Burkholderia vietnamiensis]